MPALIVSAAVIIENGSVLFTQRPGGTHLEHLWEFPGGKVEDGESPSDALARELREELGINCQIGDILEVTFWRYPKRDVLLLFYLAERSNRAQPIQHLGVSAHAWVNLSDMNEYPMPPADVPVLSKVRRLLEVSNLAR